MRAVHFGAGNIGRGLIGPILSDSGYEVCFVARNERQVNQLRERGQYPVTLANDNRDRFTVDNVTAIRLSDTEEVAEAIAGAELVTTAVGITALKDIAETIARGIELRLSREGMKVKPLHVMACENGIGSGQQLKRSVYRHMNKPLRELAERCVAFPNVMVDRIVPVQKNKDPLEVLVEPYSEWVIPRSGLIGGDPELKGARYVESLDPYLERKLFTMNTGHCCAAYFGFLEGWPTVQKAMSDPGVRQRVYGVLKETGEVLIRKHGFDPAVHERYISKTMTRFSNPNFSDKITRVARSPLRKLSPNDRLVKPALLAYEYGLDTPNLISAIASALFFDHPGDPEALSLQESLRTTGIHAVIEDRLGLLSSHPLHSMITASFESLAMSYPHMAGSAYTALTPNLFDPSSTESQ
ncbi:Mannitol-1-phosphate 5-dehydrogenase [compost metagenome]